MSSQFNVRNYSVRTLAIFSLIGVAFGYAVLGMNSRLLNQGFLPATQVYVRILLGFGLSLIAFRKKLRKRYLFSISKMDAFWLVVMGAVGYTGSVLFSTLAALNAKLVNASVIGATVPFVVYIYSFFLLKEKHKSKLLIVLVPAIYGVSTIASKSFIPDFSSFGIGEMFAVVSVLSLGWWSLGRKMLSDHLNNQEITIVTMLIAGIASLIVAILKREALSLHSFTLPPVIVGVIIGAGLNLGLTYLETFAFKNINLVFGNQLLMTSTVFSLVGGIVFYQEYVSIPEIVGGLIILSSVWQANKLANR